MAPNYKQIYARKRDCERRIKAVCPEAEHESGIYCFHRISEDGFKFAYVGQATKSLLTRLGEHLLGYQHIDLSIRKHGLYDAEKNPYGYKVEVLCRCTADECDEKEQFYIKQKADEGYQLRNHTGGSQGTGKRGFDDHRPAKGYHDGLKQGEKNAKQFVADLFSKHLDFVPKKQPPTKLQVRAMEKFEEFLKEDE